MAINKLTESDIKWHKNNSDIPGLSAGDMKALLDQPAEVLMAKVNEVIGADGAPNLEEASARLDTLDAQVEDLGTVTASKADQTAVNELNFLLGSQINSLENRLDNDVPMDIEMAIEDALKPVQEQQAADRTQIDELRVSNQALQGEINEHESALESLRSEKQDVLTAGEGITIEQNVISAVASREQDIVTEDMQYGLTMFGGGGESRASYNLYILGDNGYGGIEPTAGLPVESGSIAVKGKTDTGGYYIIVFRNDENGSGYLIRRQQDSDVGDSLTEFSLKGQVLNEIDPENPNLSESVPSAQAVIDYVASILPTDVSEVGM